MRVLFVGDYPLDLGLRKYHDGLYPSHNLFGLVELPGLGIQTAVAKHVSSELFDKVFRRLGLGNSVASQISVVLIAKRDDVIFSVCLPSVGLLALLKRFRLLRNRLVTLVHHPSKPSPAEKFVLGANDRLFFLSKHGLDSCRHVHGLPAMPMSVLPWGPQCDFYSPTSLPGGPLHVVAAGKSSRDYHTLVEAAKQINVRVTIVCSRARFPSITLPSNVTWIGGMDDTQPLEESELTALYESAHVIAVPLVQTDVLAGLTSLLDAMAIHRPVIITRNPNIDIDVDAEGVGWWVEAGNVSSWVKTLDMALHDRQRLHQMASNAERLCKNKLNISRFVAALKLELLSL